MKLSKDIISQPAKRGMEITPVLSKKSPSWVCLKRKR